LIFSFSFFPLDGILLMASLPPSSPPVPPNSFPGDGKDTLPRACLRNFSELFSRPGAGCSGPGFGRRKLLHVFQVTRRPAARLTMGFARTRTPAGQKPGAVKMPAACGVAMESAEGMGNDLTVCFSEIGSRGCKTNGRAIRGLGLACLQLSCLALSTPQLDRLTACNFPVFSSFPLRPWSTGPPTRMNDRPPSHRGPPSARRTRLVFDAPSRSLKTNRASFPAPTSTFQPCGH